MSRRKKRTLIQQTHVQQKKSVPFVVALANKVLNAIGFVDYIDRTVQWDQKQCKISPGNLAKAFILATFFEVRAPLSRIAERFDGIDTELLFGEGVEPEDLTDDAIGRTLDKIAEASPGKMYTTLCLAAYAVYKIAFRRLHSDTTTLSFYGDYDMQAPDQISDLSDEEILRIVKGYNKDHRRGCNQVVVGKIVNEHGIPLANSVMDGNTSDVAWNTKALKLVAELFAKDLEQFIYIADSKLMNITLFKTMMDANKTVRFISLCPASFSDKMAARVTNEAYEQNEWVDLGSISERKRASEYKAQEFVQTVDEQEIRCIAYQTSEGKERFEHKKTKALIELEEAIKQVHKKEFACEADAVKELERFQKEHKNCLYVYSANIVATQIEKRPRGNPGKSPKPAKIETKWQLRIELTGENQETMETLKRKEECFVLVTNVDKTASDARDILGNYKNQAVVEIQYRLLKEPCIASVIYLDTPDRIRAMVMLLGISLLIRALVQYKLRKGYQECEKELPKIGWNRAKLQPNITMFFFICALNNHAFVREKKGTTPLAVALRNAKSPHS